MPNLVIGIGIILFWCVFFIFCWALYRVWLARKT
jgi:hypothetical protein